MTEKKTSSPSQSRLSRQISAKAERELKARRKSNSEVWLGLGMIGMIGWSVVVPTLLGAALGLWLDQQDPGHHSWTLALLAVGLVLGCLNAWHWVAQEDKAIQEEHRDV